ncbi:hypothetical protein AQUCO_04100167v1 [Aquilegia coerulea]|uniref:Homeobox domain-containing protein n=1 Tax=Aquilegia coerulea TaxID=218851 RepID=A0A2G5CQG9_AQUCA|nr:hypothetical protein AQUCO_04100167v1 [Aquilegia coerulea]
MASLHSSCSLELSVSVPGFTSSSASLHSTTGDGSAKRDFDINEVPLTMEEDQESWLAKANDDKYEEQDSGGGGGGGGGDGYGSSNKKLRLTKEQTDLLEESFKQNRVLNAKQKDALAFQLGLKPRQVEVWFQNRRARTKLKQTEMECEYLKICFTTLTEENKRLQREAEQLRALRRVGQPPNNCEPLPAESTLTMCPRCERVTSRSSSSTSNELRHSPQPSAYCPEVLRI